MDTTKEGLVTVASHGTGYVACGEFARMGYRVLPGRCDHHKRELVNW